jgi:hypothetical protein
MPFEFAFAPFVIAQRLPLLWWEAMGGNSKGPRESRIMVTEKVEAAQRGLFAAQREAMTLGFEMQLAALRGDPVRAARIMADGQRRIAEAALRPAARRVGANTKRLGRAS